MAVADLVAAINVRHSNGGKRLTKGDQLYKHMIASLQANGINITHNALKQRVIDVVVENSDMVCGLEGSVDKDDNENE